jgi:hypothetical protein
LGSKVVVHIEMKDIRYSIPLSSLAETGGRELEKIENFLFLTNMISFFTPQEITGFIHSKFLNFILKMLKYSRIARLDE